MRESSEPTLLSANPSGECLPLLPPAFRPAFAAVVLGPRHSPFKEVDIYIFHVCKAHANEGRLRKAAKRQGVKLTCTLITCSECVLAKGRRTSLPTTALSRKAPPLQRGFIDLVGPEKIASAGGPLYLILFKDDETHVGWLYLFESKNAAEVVAATPK